VRGSACGATFEVATCELAGRLRPYVRGLVGYTERTPGLLRRNELPSPQVVVIVELGPPIRVFDGASPRSFRGGFVAGLDDRATLCEHDGYQHGVQLDLTPIGARLFFGMPMSELAGQVVAIDDVLPRAHRGLAERLSNLDGWEPRFDLLERLLEERLAELPAATRLVAWAVRRIEERGGMLDGRTLARDLGYSQKHVIDLFRDHVGVPPKQLARLVRFDRLVRTLRSGAKPSWAQLAAELGYFDQSHLVRDVKRFTGTTPTQMLPGIVEVAAIFGR
jgi:AraC-like DNA-binding protein